MSNFVLIVAQYLFYLQKIKNIISQFRSNQMDDDFFWYFLIPAGLFITFVLRCVCKKISFVV